MEFQSLQKGFFEADSNQPNERNIFIRRTYSLLLLEYLIVGGISLIIYLYLFWYRIWVFGLLMFVCQVCHFYFEFSQTGGYDQQKKIMNYVFSTIDLICLAFTFFFFWDLFREYYDGYVWIIYLQLGVVILLLNFYTNQTSTNFENSSNWLIALITPITIEFILRFFWFMDDSYSQFQTYLTLIVTWYSCFMLQISQNFIFESDITFDQIQKACCKLLGAQYQIIVLLIKFFFTRNNDQNNLILADEKEKRVYFEQVTITFTSLIMMIFLYITYGNGFMIDFSTVISEIPFYDQMQQVEFTTVTFRAIFWVSLSFSIVFYVLTIILHRKINFLIKWALFLTQNIFNFFFIVGISYYLAYNNQYTYQYYYKDGYYYFYNYLLQRDYFLQIAFCMFAGLGIGLQSYSLMNREDIDYKKAFLFGIINPFLIFISQIYYTYIAEGDGVFIAYIFAILVVFTVYLCLILFELHQQITSDKIDFDTKEYYLGAMLIFQPVKTIFTRIISLFLS